MSILSKFSETLIELIFDNGLTHQDIENATGLSNGNVSMWVNQKVAPNLPSLIKLSEFFTCSIDYLLCRNDNKKICDLEIITSLPERLRKLAKEKNKSVYKIAIDLNIDETIAYRWVRGVVMPNLYNLEKLADYFGGSVDYLIGRKD